MKNLEEFLYKFKDTEQEIPYSFTKTIKNFSPKSQESRKIIMKINAMKKIIIIAMSLLLGSGVVFAATKTYENIWKQPETYEYSYNPTEREKKEAISEEEAKNKAIECLEKLGLEKEITKIYLMKEPNSGEILWEILFKTGSMQLSTNGEFKNINIPSYSYKLPDNYGITKEEAKETAQKLLAKYNPENSNEYELVNLNMNMEDEKLSYIWYATFYKKYDNLLNKYEKIDIAWVPTINGLYNLSIENFKYENNEQIISKEEAIKIATDKDKNIEARYDTLSVDAEIGIEKMNSEVVYREKNIEEYDNGRNYFIQNEDNEGITIKDDAVFYKVDNRVRKVWKVTINYDYYKYDRDLPEKFIYYVDATTGEIIGGSRV